ncbi:MAG: histidinol-phosphatase [Spirochaetia bacterium]|jgi:histidinol-phosphatase (PHP family)|nr:histidinol-phosphatase [Spirochaetia bacterium]
MGFISLHNHTELCGHASGSIDEYIKAAIEKNITCFGFSDHAPVSVNTRESMSSEETETYIDMVLSAKDRYAESIEILLAFEVDYPLHASFAASYFTDERIDYLIGSCHFIDGWAFDNEKYIDEFSKRDVDDIYTKYYKTLESLVSSRLFNIVGHFDLPKKFGHRPLRDFGPTIESLAKKMSKEGMAFEVNTAGLIKPVGEMYPSKEIIDIFFRCNVPATMGSDSHSPQQAGCGYDLAIETLKAAGYRKLTVFRKRKPFEIVM